MTEIVLPDPVVEEPAAKKPRTTEDSAAVGESGLVAPPPAAYYGSLDIEHLGTPLSDTKRLLQIGLCFGRTNGEILLQRSFCWPVPPPAEFDKKTWDEFWSKYPEILARIAAETSLTPLADFLECVMDLETQYGPFGKRGPSLFTWVSDQPAADIGGVNLAIYQLARGVADHKLWYELSSRLGDVAGDTGTAAELINMLEQLKAAAPAESAQPRARSVLDKQGARCLNEMFASYVPTDDPTERQRALSAEARARVDARVTAPHSHYALDDATELFQRACAVTAELSALKQ